MKSLKRSLVTATAVCTLGVSLNATTLQEALKGGTVNGEIRSIIVNDSSVSSGAYSNAGILNNANSGSIGIQLNYETASYYGFKAQVGFQSSHDLDLDDDSVSSPVSGEREPRASAEGTNMQYLNLSYGIAKTEIRAGKQKILTTLVGNSNVFPLVDSFNALSIKSKDIKNTDIQFYAIRDWYERYHANVGYSRVTHFETPSYSIFVKNKTTDRLTLEGQYLTVSEGISTEAPVSTGDSYSVYYGAFDYKLPVGFPLSLGAFHAGAQFDEVGEDDTTMSGIKLGGKVANVIYKLAYTTVDDDNDFVGTFGHVPNFFKYNGGQMFTDNIYAGVDTTSLLVIPNFGIKGLKTLFSYSIYSQSQKGIDINEDSVNLDGTTELQADLRYNFGNGLNIRYQVAMIEYDVPGVDDNSLTASRLYLNYKF